MDRGSDDRPVFGVDLDNVLCFTDPLIRSLIQDMFGVRLTQADITQFSYASCGISAEQERAVFDRFHKVDCLAVGPIAEAVAAVQALHSLFEIHVVTARPPETRRLTVAWLRKHNVAYEKLDFSKDKHESPVDFRAFIDDKRETAYELAKAGVQSFLLDYPWNQPAPVDPPNVIRVKTWREARALIQQLACT